VLKIDIWELRSLQGVSFHNANEKCARIDSATRMKKTTVQILILNALGTLDSKFFVISKVHEEINFESNHA